MSYARATLAWPFQDKVHLRFRFQDDASGFRHAADARRRYARAEQLRLITGIRYRRFARPEGPTAASLADADFWMSITQQAAPERCAAYDILCQSSHPKVRALWPRRAMMLRPISGGGDIARDAFSPRVADTPPPMARYALPAKVIFPKELASKHDRCRRISPKGELSHFRYVIFEIWLEMTGRYRLMHARCASKCRPFCAAVTR